MGHIVPHDEGSTLLGFTLAFLSLDFYRSNRITLAVATFPFFLAALPVLDAALAIIRRLRSARSLVLGDRRHVYDLILVRGSSARSVAFTLLAITTLLAVVGWLALKTQGLAFVTLGALIVAALLAVGIRLGALRSTQPRVTSLSPACEAETRPAWRE